MRSKRGNTRQIPKQISCSSGKSCGLTALLLRQQGRKGIYLELKLVSTSAASTRTERCVKKCGRFDRSFSFVVLRFAHRTCPILSQSARLFTNKSRADIGFLPAGCNCSSLIHHLLSLLEHASFICCKNGATRLYLDEVTLRLDKLLTFVACLDCICVTK